MRTFLMNGTELYSMPLREPNRLRVRHDWLEVEPAGNGFEDDERRVAKFADSLLPEKTVVLTARVSGVENHEYIEFERLGGKARVFLNDVEIGDNFQRSGRLSFSNVRPYRFSCRFRKGENELKIISVLRENDGSPISGYAKIGLLKEQPAHVRLHGGLARVFVRSDVPEKVRVEAAFAEH